MGWLDLLKVIDPEPVLVDQSACLPARHRRSPCRACTGVCPAAAISFSDGRLTVDAAACTRCGLCAGACPTEALQVRGLTPDLLDGAVRVRCARAGGEGVELPCLGWLSADHMVQLAGAELAAADCAACPHARGGSQARAALERAAAILAVLGGEPPRWVTAPESATERLLSRRELFQAWRRTAAQTGRSLRPQADVNPARLLARVPARRLRWLRHTAPPRSGALLPWPARAATGACNGCAICVAFCPTGALSATEAEGTWRLRFQAAACIDCATCIQLCPRRAMGRGDPPTAAEVVGGEARTLAAVPAAMRPQEVPSAGRRIVR